MGTLTTCCCGCCLEPADMPYTSVSLIAPTDDCEGGLGEGLGIGGGGTPAYPSASFSQLGCCHIADFALACQSYTENCAVYASQNLTFGYDVDFYESKISYLDQPGDCDCDCVLVQSKRVDFDRTDKIYWVGRYKLVGLRVHVGKISVTCDGESAECKYYVAVSYIFETCDYTLNWINGISQYPEYTIDYDCTGQYRDGTCSFTNTWQETSEINDCTDVLAEDPWQFCDSLEQQVISRIKLFDTLPTGQLTFTNADLPPVGCCGGSTNCVVSGSPCGLNLISNCVNDLPLYDGPEMDYFCQQATGNNPGPGPYADECSITIGCPEIKPMETIERACQCYLFDEESGCYELQGSIAQQYPGFDSFICGYCDLPEGRFYYDTNMYNTFNDSCNMDPLICVTGDCCFDPAIPEVQYNCQEFNGERNSANWCKVEISNYTCTVGALQTFSVGSFCYNLPTVTIELE